MLSGRLLGRPHMCLSLQQSRSSQGVREKVSSDECISFDESIRNLAIKSHRKAILMFSSKTKLIQGLWGQVMVLGCVSGFYRICTALQAQQSHEISWAHVFTQP